MGKKLKWREARRREADRALRAELEAHARTEVRARGIEHPNEFKPEYRDTLKVMRGYALRAPEDWRCRIKTRDQDKRFIDLVRFAFGRYRVATHLENAWISYFTDDFVDRVTPMPEARPNRTMQRWYLVVAQGGSLYKQYASPYLTKLETHHFLSAPEQVTTSQEALWYAVACAHGDRPDVARAISRSNLQAYSIASTWWKEVARFFAHEPITSHEMHDLIDFLRVAKTENPAFSLKGRSLASLQRRMEEWHRALRKSNEIGGGVWAGSLLPDVEYETGSEDKKAIWRFRQIRTGNELFREGQRMHHCVASYKHLCMTGTISIWSLTSEYPLGYVNRGVTMEVRKDGAIVQCRGFANRRPYGNEVAMVKRWADEYGLRWASFAG
jgi:hypothetical protein